MSLLESNFLLLESNSKLRTALKEELKNLGCLQVYEASRVKDALELLEQNPIHCALISWDLEGANGFSLFKLLRTEARFKSIKVVMISTATEETGNRIKQAALLKVDGFLIEPISHEALKAVMVKITA